MDVKRRAAVDAAMRALDPQERNLLLIARRSMTDAMEWTELDREATERELERVKAKVERAIMVELARPDERGPGSALGGSDLPSAPVTPALRSQGSVHAKKPDTGRRRVYRDKVCERCGATFTPKGPRQVVCHGPECDPPGVTSQHRQPSHEEPSSAAVEKAASDARSAPHAARMTLTGPTKVDQPTLDPAGAWLMDAPSAMVLARALQDLLGQDRFRELLDAGELLARGG